MLLSCLEPGEVRHQASGTAASDDCQYSQIPDRVTGFLASSHLTQHGARVSGLQAAPSPSWGRGQTL
jgi:hypothetical protein